LFTDHEKDNDKYEIIEEILGKLVNPIFRLMEMHEKDIPQLMQTPVRKCSIIEALQEHDKCSEFDNTGEVCNNLVKIPPNSIIFNI